MSGTTLVIVDMQHSFPASRKRDVIKGVIREIHLAQKRGDAAIIVEYTTHGRTHMEIMNTILDSGIEYCVVVKQNDDGGSEVIDGCVQNGFSCERFRVCGVNTTACVMKTASGILREVPHSGVEIAWHATGDSYYDGKEYDASARSVVHKHFVENNICAKILG